MINISRFEKSVDDEGWDDDILADQYSRRSGADDGGRLVVTIDVQRKPVDESGAKKAQVIVWDSGERIMEGQALVYPDGSIDPEDIGLDEYIRHVAG